MHCCPRSIKCVDATWGISGDACCIYCVFYRYANHELPKLVSLELTTVMSATTADNMYALYIGQTFLW
jgi:hypothetical protein